jgi:hypothetical protein
LAPSPPLLENGTTLSHGSYRGLAEYNPVVSGKNRKAVSITEVAHGLKKVKRYFGQFTGRLHLRFCSSTTSKKR